MINERLTQAFQQQFHAEPEYLVVVPGLLYLMDNMAITVERYLWLAVKPRADKLVKIYSVNNANYVEQSEAARGFDAVLYSNIPGPINSALDVAKARAVCELAGEIWMPTELFTIGQLSQLLIATAETGQVSLLTNKGLNPDYMPLPEDVAVVVMSSVLPAAQIVDAVTILQQQNISRLGELMTRSDQLVPFINAATNSVGCYGARIAGYGCAVALVKEMYVDDFIDQVSEQYEHETAIKPNLYVTRPMGSVTIEQL